jgi:hypothetical protein
LSHLPVLFVPVVCYLSHLSVLFVSLSVLIVTLLGKNIRKKKMIRKINSVRKSLTKPADLRWHVGTRFPLTGTSTLAAWDCREVVA